MTTSTSRPIALDLATINEVQQVVVRAIRDRVCSWEQDALDARKRGEYVAAQQYHQWSVAAELCASAARTACSAIFMDAYACLSVFSDYREVQLPDLARSVEVARSVEDRHLDDLTVEVASQQPDPF